MRDDIPTLLRDAAADPSHTPDFDVLAAHGRRQHLAGRMTTALVAVVALVAGGVALWPSSGPANRMPAIGDAPATASPQTPAGPALPSGWQQIRVGDAVLGVPGDWEVQELREPTPVCPNMADRPTAYVHLAGLEPERACKLPATTSLTVEVAPLSGVPDVVLEPDDGRSWETVTTSTGLAGQRLDRGDNGLVLAYRFPELDLWLQFADGDVIGARPEPILETITAVEAEDRTTSPTPSDHGTDGSSLALPRPVPNHPEALVRAGAAGQQVACEGPLHLGGWAVDFGGPGIGASNPDSALQAFLDQGLFGIPRDGYQQAATEPGRVLFTHDVDGVMKVAVIVADSAAVEEPVGVDEGWGIETFATCDPAEYGPTTHDELGQTVWTDRDGDPVPTSTITSYPGHPHCDWQSVTSLHLDDRQYLRDPQHLLTDQTVHPYEGDGELPDDAVDTGYRNDGRELWLAADSSVAYVVTDSTVEIWPSTTTPVGCA